MKWLDPKFYMPDINVPFIAYINNIFVQETIDPEKREFIPYTEVIVATMDRDKFICDLFSYHRENLTCFEYDSLILWRKLPKRPKNLKLEIRK